MTRFVFPILVILHLWLPVSSIAGTLDSIHIEDNDKGITIRVDDAHLGEVLKSIEGKTGIHFHISPSVLNDRMTVNLDAPDWQAAMKLLLEPYSRVELWGPRLGLTKINILSRTGAAASETETSSSPMLTREQFLKLAKGPFKAPLSPELFEDTENRAFLN